MRISGAFATRWYEEWRASGDAMLSGHHGVVSEGERKARIERFLEAMAPGLAKVLLEPAHAEPKDR